MTNQINGTYNENHNNVQVKSESVKSTKNTEFVEERAQSTRSDKAVDAKGTEKESSDKVPTEKQMKQIKQAVDEANQRTKFTKKSFEYAFDDQTNRVSITVRDQETDEVIREIPAEETLDMLAKIWELAGIVVDEKR